MRERPCPVQPLVGWDVEASHHCNHALGIVGTGGAWYSDDAAEHAAITGRPTHDRTLANIREALTCVT